MALEQAGEGLPFNIKKLVGRLQKKFPDYDFTKSIEIDRKCKVVIVGKKCSKESTRITHMDMDGNELCGHMYKLQDENNPYRYENVTCNAVIATKEEKKKYEQGEIW
tara:strand:- start:1109 stop:1429 length:321 start_codon:yes stop_codon:yes gene_type:complete